jgi:hypothetical protein
MRTVNTARKRSNPSKIQQQVIVNKVQQSGTVTLTSPTTNAVTTYTTRNAHATPIPVKTTPQVISINTEPQLTPLGRVGLGMYNTGSDYANILNTDYKDKSILNQAIGHAFEGNWDKAGQIIQNNPYRFAGNLAVEAGSFLIPVGGILKVAKVAKATQKAKYALMEKIDDSKTITKYLDSAGTPLTKQQKISVEYHKLSGDNYVYPIGKTRNTQLIKAKIKGSVTRFKNRNKVIEIIDPQSKPPTLYGFIDSFSHNVIYLNPKNIRTFEQSIDTLSHESIHEAIISGEKISPTSITASSQYDNISYGSKLFRAKTLDAMNTGIDNNINWVSRDSHSLKQRQKITAHVVAVVDDISPRGTGSTRGTIVKSREHGITGFDYVSSVTKIPKSESIIRRGDAIHFDKVGDIMKTTKDKKLEGNKGYGYKERIFNQKNMELDKAFEPRFRFTGQEVSAGLTKSKNKWREEFIPFQKAKLAKKRAKELKLAKQSDQRQNIGHVSAMFVPITVSTVSKAKAAIKGAGRRFNQDQSFGGFGQFL